MPHAAIGPKCHHGATRNHDHYFITPKKLFRCKSPNKYVEDTAGGPDSESLLLCYRTNIELSAVDGETLDGLSDIVPQAQLPTASLRFCATSEFYQCLPV